MTEEPLRIKHLDPASMRTLAHPLRVRLVALLRTDGPATASGLAERLGISSGLASYHLRALADADFIEDDPERAAGGRERWWRSSYDMTSWRPSQAGDDPDTVAAEQWLSGFGVRRSMEWLDEWMTRRPEATPAWQEAATASDYLLDLTPAELDDLLEEIDALVRPRMTRFVDRAPDPDPDPERLPVRLLLQAFPRGDS
jgi:DNA-binding transcriptional ArsR family regulator